MRGIVVGSFLLLIGLSLWLGRSSVGAVAPEVPRRERSPDELVDPLADPDEGLGRVRRRASQGADPPAGRISSSLAEAREDLVGVVVDPRGTPVPGARVAVAVEANGEAVALAERSVADAEGRFTLPVPSEVDELIVTARTSELAPTVLRTRDRSVRLELTVGLSVRGRVVDARGRPVEAAVVAVEPWSWVPWLAVDDIDRRSATVGEDGRFELAGLPPATLIARASAEGYAHVREAREPEELDQPWELVLVPGGPLEGRVVNADGEPVGGIRLELEGGGSGGTRGARSAPDGTFRFEGVPHGEAFVVWEPDDWSPGFLALDLPSPDPVEVVLRAPAAIAGRVWTPAGGGYSIGLDSEGMRFRERFEDGTFRLGGLPAGVFDVTVTPDGGAARDLGSFVLAEGRVVDVGTITFGRGTTAFGRVEFTDGEAAAGSCSLERFRNGPFPWEDVSSASLEGSGRFEFTDVEPGRYRVAVKPHGGIPLRSEPRFVEVGVDVDFGLLLCSRARTVRVTLLGLDGEPVPQRSMPLSSHGTLYARRTDAAGTCVFREVEPGLAHVSVRVEDGYQRFPIEVPEDSDVEATISLKDLREGAVWSARLLDSGRPLAECSLTLFALDESWGTMDTLTDEDGSFRMTGLHDGPGLLTIYVPERKAYFKELLPEPRPADLRLRLGALRGTVEGGAPELPVWLDRLEWLRSGDPRLAARGRGFLTGATDESGSFEFRALPAGPYRVRVQVSEGRTIERDVQIEPGSKPRVVSLDG